MGMRQEAGNWRTAVKHKLVLAGREDQPAVKVGGVTPGPDLT